MKLYRDGMVHVLDRKCDTCIFRPGNLMQLTPGRVKEMVGEAQRNRSCIICHETLGTKRGAVCRGFFDKHAAQSLPLSVAQSMGLIEWQKVKP
jgi:hypothetical protein